MKQTVQQLQSKQAIKQRMIIQLSSQCWGLHLRTQGVTQYFFHKAARLPENERLTETWADMQKSGLPDLEQDCQ
jgi:hypothetical protein